MYSSSSSDSVMLSVMARKTCVRSLFGKAPQSALHPNSCQALVSMGPSHSPLPHLGSANVELMKLISNHS